MVLDRRIKHAFAGRLTRRPFRGILCRVDAAASSLLLRSITGSDRGATRKLHHDDDATASACALSRYGLGSHQWAKLDPRVYQGIVRTALENRVDTIEAGQEDGARRLADAYRVALQENPSLEQQPLTILRRIGYRSVVVSDGSPDASTTSPSSSSASSSDPLALPNDVKVEEYSVPTHHNETDPPSVSNSMITRVLHNVSAEYVTNALSNCPLLHLADDYSNVRIVPLLHNPEVQGSQLGASTEERQEHIRHMLVSGFTALEHVVQASETPAVHQYGVVSNGLCLPRDHPLFLDHATVLEAADLSSADRSHFAIVQLPVNVLERRGLEVARAVRRGVTQRADRMGPVRIYGMRPLQCYPDLGTGRGHAIALVDHWLPVGEQEESAVLESGGSDARQVVGTWTNAMTSLPSAYQDAFRTAMSYFDAEELLHKKVTSPDALSDDERETLEACQHLQQLLRDLDARLEDHRVLSLEEHDQFLMQRVVSFLHGSLESMDEESASVLEQVFATYAVAVRYAVARNTRMQLVGGGDGQSTTATVVPKCRDLEQSMRLQEYALRFVLQHDAGVVDKVIVGSSSPEQVVDNLETMYKLEEEDKKTEGERKATK